MNQSNPVQTFLHEADDLLARIEDLALELGHTAPTPDSINQLFRAFHTIKGSGAMFGFDQVAAFTHHVETALDHVREGRIALSPEMLECVLIAKDHIKALMEADQGGEKAKGEDGDRVIAMLSRLCNLTAQPAEQSSVKVPLAVAKDVRDASVSQAAEKDGMVTWKIHFRPNPNLLICGTNPASLLDELRRLGDCTVAALTDGIPPLDKMEPDRCYLAWDIRLRTSASLNEIKDVFIFVEDGSDLSIVAEPASGAAEIAKPLPGAMAPASVSGESGPSRAPETDSVALLKSVAKESVVRVPSARLDRLVGLVGELVMNQSRLNEVSSRLSIPDLTFPAEQIDRIVDELREEVLGIRMMPIGSTFGRFKRLVHDLSRELGKEIELLTEGADTELDKTVLDRLGDPLVHLIRNSIDHGIETASLRQEQGKPACGTIRLSAVHTGSNVVVTIKDDGRGIDRDAVRRKALEKGLISAEASLTDNELLSLVFMPGFSTAKTVTSVSGRGVGMDVVKREIEALRGSISIASTFGTGTSISLSLPLTLAIVDGLVVVIDGDDFVIPMSAVTENVELTKAEHAAFNGRHVLPVRGELIPYISLREAFSIQGEGPNPEKIVIVQHGGERVGLVVDRVVGNYQTVIQSLGHFYRDIRTFSGATIMGNGRVALILDVAGLVRHVGALSTGFSKQP